MRIIPSSFWQWISTLNSDDLAGVLICGAVVCLAAIGTVCITIYAIHKNRTEDALKRELLDRGVSADEIATIIGAKPNRSQLRRFLPPRT
ncbi:MAG TPA: hypothetical protein VHE81_01800 [Lacipirellulaceae bacterium]|nr:hypothetical protein [Lacipirellulaceae bacterium]